jgi:hypothetical protein
MKKILYTLIILFFFNAGLKAQSHTSLTDIYMGNFGFWDYQSSGSLQALEQDSLNNQVYHAVYLTADSTLVNPSKRVLYFYSNNNGVNWSSAVVANVNSSYPSLALQSDGKAVICFLDSAAARLRIYRSTTAGALTFDTLPSPPGAAGTNPKILYYRNYLVLFALFGGQLQKIRYNYSTASWESWQIIGTNVSAAYQAAKGWNGRLAACWISGITQKPVNYVESLDSGNTFSGASTIFTQDITGNDTVRALAHIDIVYYSNLPAVTWDGIARILPVGGQDGIQKFYHNPRIYFWNPANGVKVVADSLNNGSSAFPGRNFMLSMGSNWSTLCGPSIGVSGYSGLVNLYIGYSAVKINVPFGNLWFDSDIFIKLSNNGGSSWFTYFTGATTDNLNDDRFVCMNKRNSTNFGYSFAFTEQKDKFPGSFRAGDTAFITRAYPEFFLISVFIHTVLENGSDPDEFDLCPNYPNPFNASTHIEYWLPKKGHVKIDVYDLLGRKAVTLLDGSEISNVGSSYVIFDGTNFSSGVYICRMFVDGSFIDARKMVLAK